MGLALSLDAAADRARGDGVAVALIERLLNHFDSLLDKTLFDAYALVADAAAALPGLTMKKYATGAPKEFATATPMRALVARIVLEDEARGFRTIHKAKSAEFDNVLVCLKDESCIDHILSPGSAKSEEEQEEQRMTYVGLSRARSRLVSHRARLVGRPECEAALAEMAVQSIRLP